MLTPNQGRYLGKHALLVGLHALLVSVHGRAVCVCALGYITNNKLCTAIFIFIHCKNF